MADLALERLIATDTLTPLSAQVVYKISGPMADFYTPLALRLKILPSMVAFLELHTNESSDCLLFGLHCLLVVVRAVADVEVVLESQVQNLA